MGPAKLKPYKVVICAHDVMATDAYHAERIVLHELMTLQFDDMFVYSICAHEDSYSDEVDRDSKK